MASNFELLAKALAAQGVRSPGGLAATIGNRKYGKPTMAKAAARGMPAAKVKPMAKAMPKVKPMVNPMTGPPGV